MIETTASLLRPILELPFVRRTRRNHGYEHATIHMLSRRVRGLKIAGRADNSGFYLYGEVDTEQVWQAAQEALSRLKSGEARWAIHPNCGTNLVTTSLMTSTAAIIGLTGANEQKNGVFARLPLVTMLTIIALLLSQPIGLSIQQHITTAGDPGDLELKDVTRHETNMWGRRMTVHRVHTQKG